VTEEPEHTAPDADAYEDRSFSVLRANAGALVLVGPPVAALTALFIALHGWPSLYQPLVGAPILGCAVVLAAGIVAHEVLHAVAWKLAARPPKGTVRLGFQWKTVTPYAHCSVPMSARAYRIGAVTPGIVLGLIPIGLGLVSGWGGWMNFGILFTIAAGGDALIIWLLRGISGHRRVIDHPTRAGCLLLNEEERTSVENAT